MGIFRKQVPSHFILYKSKHTPSLGMRTMSPEWAAIHHAAQSKMPRSCLYGLKCLTSVQTRAAVAVLNVFAGVTASLLITARMLPGKSAAVSSTESARGWSFVLPPTLSIPLLDSPLLFSNKPGSSLLLTCLLVCVTSIHNNIIIRFCLKLLFSPLSSLFFLPAAPPLPHLLVLAGSGMSGLRRGGRGKARGWGDVEKKKTSVGCISISDTW